MRLPTTKWVAFLLHLFCVVIYNSCIKLLYLYESEVVLMARGSFDIDDMVHVT